MSQKTIIVITFRDNWVVLYCKTYHQDGDNSNNNFHVHDYRNDLLLSIIYKLQKNYCHPMDIEQHYEHKKIAKKLRIKITTNRNIQFITAIRPQATISELANRALSVYLELSGQSGVLNTSKKQLTVSAVKQGVFYMPKSEFVSNLLNQDDEVEVVIIKAKPKYPHQFGTQQFQQSKKEAISNKTVIIKENNDKNQKIINQIKQDLQIEKLHETLVLQTHPVRQYQRDISKRQKKKEKKKEKFQKKKKNFEQFNEKQKQQNFRRQITPQIKEQMKQRQILFQSLPKKKAKLQKQEPLNSSQKIPIVVPSPKITFHPDPKIDSPRISLLSESQKKKFNYQSNKTSQNNIRKPSQDLQKKNNLQKIVSPNGQIKSPFFPQKNSAQTNNISEAGKQKEKQQLSSFSLIRKDSEDRKIQERRQKSKEEISSSKQKNDTGTTKDINIIKISTEKLADKFKEKHQTKQIPSNQQSKTIEKGLPSKTLKSLQILQSQSDSQSQQNKKVHYYPFPNHHRSKQLSQIKNQSNLFLKQFDEQQ